MAISNGWTPLVVGCDKIARTKDEEEEEEVENRISTFVNQSSVAGF